MTTVEQTQPKQNNLKPDSKALWGGILFSLAVTLLIWLVGQETLGRFTLIEDNPEIIYWYPWRLAEPTFWSHATAWIGYTAHQVFLWWMIYTAQQKRPKYTNNLHRFNVIALAGNAFFVILHFLQTQLFYDGLAASTPEALSQFSVIFLLVFVMLMENQRRGLLFGKKVKGAWMKEAGRVTRKYHGYYFAWAIIFTFWYHPTEFTGGHLVGFFYMFLLILQGSLFFTRMHVNKYWMVVQEVMVLFHGTLVAIIDPNQEIWPMFFFGFAGLFVVTQMYGLGLKQWQRIGFFVAYVLGVLFVYGDFGLARGWANLNEIIRIPLIEIPLAIVLGVLVWLLAKGTEKLIGQPV